MSWFDANIVLVQSTVTTLLLALSIHYPLRVGVFSFAGAGAFGVGGYTAGVLLTRYEFTTWPAIGVAVIGGGAVTTLLGAVLYRLNGLYLAMATIAFDLIVVIVAGNLSLTGGLTGLYGAAGQIELWHLGVIAGAVVVVFVCTEFGGVSRRVDAVRDDPPLAASMGVNVGLYRLASFLISGLVGGLGGALLVLLRSTVTPDAFGFPLVTTALIIVVVGGSRWCIGVVIGTIIFTWLPNYLSALGQWQTVVYGGIVTVAAIYFPNGIWGSILQLGKYCRTRGRGSSSDSPHDTPAEPSVRDAPVAKAGAGGAVL
jgi:ABC-type branched-subunit amino acid transport system permease subunit